MANRLRTLGEELGSPAHLALYTAARKRGIKVTRAQTREFTRKTAALTKKAMVGILDTLEEQPGVISTDGGSEFSADFAEELVRRGIGQKIKDGKNSIAIVDRAIQSLKLTVAKMMATQEGSWQKMLGRAVKAINDTPKAVLHHEAPSDVIDNDDVSFMLLQDNARALRHNSQLLQTRKTRLEEAGAMRAPLQGKTFKRGHEASYRPKKALADFEGIEAIAEDGTRIDVKHLKPVNSESTDVTVRFGDKTNSVKKNKQRRQAEVLIALTLAHLEGKERVSLKALSIFLKAQLRPATENFETILRKVKLKLMVVLRLFPALEVSVDSRYVKVA